MIAAEQAEVPRVVVNVIASGALTRIEHIRQPVVLFGRRWVCGRLTVNSTGFAIVVETWRRRGDDCEVRAFQDAAGKFRFHLKAANGEIIAASQGYTSKAAAQTGIASIRDNAASAPTEDLT
jgi:uncharacterized protein YegP (UPF0339 family)